MGLVHKSVIRTPSAPAEEQVVDNIEYVDHDFSSPKIYFLCYLLLDIHQFTMKFSRDKLAEIRDS